MGKEGTVEDPGSELLQRERSSIFSMSFDYYPRYDSSE